VACGLTGTAPHNATARLLNDGSDSDISGNALPKRGPAALPSPAGVCGYCARPRSIPIRVLAMAVAVVMAIAPWLSWYCSKSRPQEQSWPPASSRCSPGEVAVADQATDLVLTDRHFQAA
jgi:hypothetical protein